MLILNSFVLLSGANADTTGTIISQHFGCCGSGYSLATAPDGSLWVGGRYNWDIAPGQMKSTNGTWSSAASVVMSSTRNTGGPGLITVGTDNSLWAINSASSVLHASNLGGAWFVSPQIDTCSAISSLATTNDGSIWVGCGDNFVQQITGSGIHWAAQAPIPLVNIPFKNLPIKLVSSSDGSLWIVSQSGVIQQLIKTGSAWALQTPLNITGSFTALAVGLDGSLWLTDNSGQSAGSLIHLVKTNGTWNTQQTIAVKFNPLGIAVATNGSVWVMSESWVQQVVDSMGQWNIAYVSGSGLGQVVIAATSDGSVWVANANNGLTRYYSISATPPSAPLNVSVANGEISFSAPSSDGGSPITSYLVDESQGSTVDFGTSICTSLMPVKCALPLNNHINDVTYFVYAINMAGKSQPATLFVGKATTPSSPTNIKLTPGNSEITVSWTQSSDLGNMPNVTYSVQAFPGGNRCQSIQSSSCTVTGLSNGTSYFFQINTSNSVYSTPVITTGESTPLATLQTTTTTTTTPIASTIVGLTTQFPFLTSTSTSITAAGMSAYSAFLSQLINWEYQNRDATAYVSIEALGGSSVIAKARANAVGNLLVKSGLSIHLFYKTTYSNTSNKVLVNQISTPYLGLQFIDGQFPVIKTINCYKGKILKRVTAVQPVCPAGYVKK